MKLVKNENWDPASDSVRHQYVDGFNFDFGVTESTQTSRLIADQGASKNAIQLTGSVESTQIQDVVGDAAVNKRTIKGYQPYVMVLNFNLDRVKNKAVREAVAYGVNSKSLIAGEGGAYGGDVAPNLFAPTLPGYEATYDPYGRLKTPRATSRRPRNSSRTFRPRRRSSSSRTPTPRPARSARSPSWTR